MVNTKMHEFKHPKYYTELRKRNRELRASTASPSVPQSDQVISKQQATASSERAPDPGLKQQAPSDKQQAPRDKPQAASDKRNLE